MYFFLLSTSPPGPLSVAEARFSFIKGGDSFLSEELILSWHLEIDADPASSHKKFPRAVLVSSQIISVVALVNTIKDELHQHAVEEAWLTGDACPYSEHRAECFSPFTRVQPRILNKSIPYAPKIPPVKHQFSSNPPFASIYNCVECTSGILLQTIGIGRHGRFWKVSSVDYLQRF